jgi:hypothetical protein
MVLPQTASGGTIIPGQDAAAGGMMAQGSGAGSIIKKMIVGGVAGAGLGAGYGLLAGMVSFLPHVTIPMGALIGGAAGVALGLVKGLLDRRKSNLALKAQQQAVAPGAGLAPTSLAGAPGGAVLRVGSNGPKVRWTQRTLKKLGMYHGRVTGHLDDKTADAIRKYEVLKGVMPTGDSTPELRAALSQDARLSTQFV